MTPRTRRQIAAPLVAVLTPWRLGRWLVVDGRTPIVLAALAGLLVIPIIETTFTVVEHVRVQHELTELPAPQGGLLAELVDGIVGPPEFPATTMAIRVATWTVAWLVGGLGSGLLTFAMLLGLHRLLTIRAGPDARAAIRPGVCAMTLWLAVATLAFALFAISRTAADPTPLRVGAAMVGLWVMVGAGANEWSVLRTFSRARAVVGAVVLGLLVLPIAAAGMQPAWQALMLWQGLAIGL
jgi:hypothetical protein